jgi:pimeloyl-ACP methyl ester carboxylesterase
MSPRAAGLLLLAFAAPAAPMAAQGGMTTGAFTVGGRLVEVDEGQLRVPADRAGSSADSLVLRFVRFRSTAAEPGAPIVFLAGGPGDAATRAFGAMPMEFLDRLRAVGDVIAFDQRGTGTSEPLRPVCPPGPPLPLDQPADAARMLDLLRVRVRDCLVRAASAGLRVAGLTTVESADDLEALSQALDAERLSFLAGSYGTHLALAAAVRHPGLVHRMVLAGVEGPDHTVKDPARVDEVLARVAAARRPTLADDIRALAARLAREPARITAPDGTAIVVGDWDLRRWVSESLDRGQEIDAMVSAIPGMLAGDFRVLARWAAGHRAPRPLNLMNVAVDCASYASAGRLARIASASARAVLGDVMAFPLPGVCDVPGLPRLPDAFRTPVRSAVPALLIAGTLDGRTPPANAYEVARGMPQARVLVIEGASHALMGHPEAMRATLEFLAERDAGPGTPRSRPTRPR